MFPGSNIPVEPNSSSPHRWDGLFPCGSEDAPLPVGGAAGGGGAGEVGLALEVVDVTEGRCEACNIHSKLL